MTAESSASVGMTTDSVHAIGNTMPVTSHTDTPHSLSSDGSKDPDVGCKSLSYEEWLKQYIALQIEYASGLPVLYYIKHMTDRSLPLIPRHSYGPRNMLRGFRILRQTTAYTQTDKAIRYETDLERSKGGVFRTVTEVPLYHDTEIQTDFRMIQPIVSELSDPPENNMSKRDKNVRMDEEKNGEFSPPQIKRNITGPNHSSGRTAGRGKKRYTPDSEGSSRSNINNSNNHPRPAVGRGRGKTNTFSSGIIFADDTNLSTRTATNSFLNPNKE